MPLLKRQRNQYRFFFHYNKRAEKMSVHFKGKCYIFNDVQCLVPCETKWDYSKQPTLVLQGYCKNIEFRGGDDLAVIT